MLEYVVGTQGKWEYIVWLYRGGGLVVVWWVGGREVKQIKLLDIHMYIHYSTLWKEYIE